MQRDPILEWREQYARCCFTVGFEPLPGATFSASVKPIFPELRTARAALSAGFLFRDDDLLRDGNDSLEVIVAQSPELNITHQGREIRLAPGDATIMQANATGRVGSRESFGFFEVVISPAEWEARGTRPEDGLMQRLSGKSEAMQLLRRYIGSVEKGLTVSFDNRPIICRHIVDLDRARRHNPLLHRREQRERRRGHSTSRRPRLHCFALLGSRTQPSQSGASLSISPRYLQRLLETSGTSFTAHVTELRLKHALMLLTAQDLSDVRICNIALRAGFSDISHFNRLFRSRFGDTPKGVRAHARMGST